MAEIGAGYVRLMARYNAWQNASVIAAAGSLGEAEMRAERGAFFGSIFATLNHALWGDRTWMSRFAGTPPPERGSIAASVEETPGWDAFRAAREAQDAALSGWAGGLGEADLAGTLRWHSAAAGREVERPLAALIVHLFNHQTHHRGQVHAMLTAAGARGYDTDLFLMPEG